MGVPAEAAEGTVLDEAVRDNLATLLEDSGGVKVVRDKNDEHPRGQEGAVEGSPRVKPARP